MANIQQVSNMLVYLTLLWVAKLGCIFCCHCKKRQTQQRERLNDLKLSTTLNKALFYIRPAHYTRCHWFQSVVAYKTKWTERIDVTWFSCCWYYEKHLVEEIPWNIAIPDNARREKEILKEQKEKGRKERKKQTNRGIWYCCYLLKIAQYFYYSINSKWNSLHNSHWL